ncbi:polysaccharide deacetylase family protein [Massilia oculi]|uniref:Polysaccharide deacetylase family protein n=1 Tax=Massilia hydrophila TaxID=3044279 RepID=A0ABS7YEE7_9BURK|nr:polysaccharide deacetylase family protein [Massilia oculi]MCA1857362.1 polysaccharide deacetylase family protein [Massilia oculi]
MKAASWSWPQGARLAVSIVVNVEEGSEYTVADGDGVTEPVDELSVVLKKPVRNYGNESNYRYGIKEGGPRIVALLEKYGITATWTAAALALERAPELAQAIRAGGHEACSHGYRWVHQYRMNEDEERDFIRKAADSIERTTGQRPVGWLSRYLITANTRRLLQEEGFRYHMDDYSADTPFWDSVPGSSRPMVIVPYALDSNDMKMWVAPALTPDQWLKYAIDTFELLYAEGEAGAQPRMMSLGLHLRIAGRPGRIGAVERFFAHISAKPGVWITTRRAIAEHFEACNPAQAAA